MSVRATFIADFTKFNDAVEKSKVTLRTFEDSIGRVDKDLARFGNAFSGNKIIQDATLIAKAVENIGGASKLTAAEQDRVNRTVTEAISKFRALGQEAPAHMLALEQATRKADDSAKGLNARLIGVASAVGNFAGNLAADLVSQAGRALIDMGKAALESSGQIVDLSNKTGLSMKTIQQMQHVADQTGGSIEQFTTAAFQLGTRIAGGSGSVRDAVQQLGLSFQDIARMRPDEQFNRIVASLGEMRDEQARNELGVQLFGKSFANIAAAVADGYRSMADEAQTSSDQQIKALDRAGDAWDKFKRDAETSVRSFLGTLVRGAEELENASALERLRVFFTGPGELLRIGREAMGREALSETTPMASHHAAAKAAQTYAQQLAKATAELQRLTAAERAEIASAMKLGVATSEIADRFSLSEEALRLYNAQQSEATRKAGEVVRENERIANAAKKEAEAVRAAVDRFKDWAAEMVHARNEAARLAPVIETLTLGLLNNNKALQDALERQAAVNGAAIDWTPITQRASEAVEKVKGVFGAMRDAASESLRELNDIFRAAFEGGGGLVGAIKSFATRITEAILALIPAIGPVLSQFAGAIVEGISRGFSTGRRGGITGAILGGLAGGVPGAIGGFFLGRAFGRQREHMRVNDLRDEFFDRHGGQAGLIESGLDDAAMRRLFDAKTVKQWEEAVRAAEATMQRTAEHAERLRTALEKYNVTWMDFEGDKRLQKLGEAIRVIEDDFAALTEAGLSHEAALLKVKDGYLQIAMEAVRAGEDIPAALAPVLLQLAEMGALTEEQAAALLGLAGQAGPTWEQVAEVAGRYGLKLDELGDKVQQLGVTDAATDLADDFKVLMEAGANTREVMAGMSDQVNEVVRRALALGLEVPESMREMLQKFADAGELTDENGEKLRDLSRIKFAQPLSDAIQGLIEKLSELIAKIGAAGSGLANLPSAVPAVPTLPVAPDVTEVMPMAAGGSGRVTKPTLFLAGEKGPEDFAFSGANKSFASEEGSDNRELVGELRGLRSDLARFPQDIAAAMAIMRGRGASFVT